MTKFNSEKQKYSDADLELSMQVEGLWRAGAWEELLSLDTLSFNNHPQEDRFKGIVACAHFQVGNVSAARELAYQVTDKSKLFALLLSGLKSSLGRARYLANDFEMAVRHWEGAASFALGVKGFDFHIRSRLLTEFFRQGLVRFDPSLLKAPEEKVIKLCDTAFYRLFKDELCLSFALPESHFFLGSNDRRVGLEGGINPERVGFSENKASMMLKACIDTAFDFKLNSFFLEKNLTSFAVFTESTE